MCEEIRYDPSTEQIVDQTGAFGRSFSGLKITNLLQYLLTLLREEPV